MNLDLDAYCRRIGHTGVLEPTFETLCALHRRHPAAIPFENLDPLCGRPVSLDLHDVVAKLVDGGRGGYCFEQNGLFQAVLEAVGFTVTPLIARVLWGAPPGAPLGPLSHRLLLVELSEGRFLADVGFGGRLYGAPVRLAPLMDQLQGEGVFRLEAEGPYLTLRTALKDAWAPLYRFTLEPAQAADYEVANWHTSTHPRSFFTNNLLAERLTEAGRSSLFNRRLTRRRADGRVEVLELATPSALSEALKTDFGLDADGDAREVFEKLPIS